MRIKTQLKLISTVAIIVLIIFISFFTWAAAKFSRAKAINSVASDIQIKVYESTSLRDQYFLYREDRPREQWLYVNREIDELLKYLEDFKAYESIVRELKDSKIKSNALVRRITENSNRLKNSTANKQVYQDLDSRLISQVYIRTHEFRNGLQEIQNASEREVERTYRQLITAITILAVFLSFVVIFISFHLIALISRRLGVIHDGAEIISHGNLDHRIESKGDDEFSDLATSINEMTTNLQTNLEQLEQERAKSIQSAKLASLGEMSASIAHEINNPLSVIQLNNSRLMDKLKKEEVPYESIEHALEKNKGAIERITKIIKGLSNISRDAAHEDIQVFSAESMMEEVWSLCRQKMIQSKIELSVSIPAGDVFVESSLTQISQVLINLINNAHDAILEFPERWIKVEFKIIKEGTVVQCTVTDSGKGIPKDIAVKIMQPFFTTKEVGKGTGLGLSISKGIIENLGGRFYIDDHCPNTRFVFELPKVYSPKT